MRFVVVIVYEPPWDNTCKKNCLHLSLQLNCTISEVWIFNIYKGCIKVFFCRFDDEQNCYEHFVYLNIHTG